MKKLKSYIFTLDDLVELWGTIEIPILTDKLVGEDFASDLQEGLELKGHNVRWVSLDDMGFISITFYDKNVTPERMSDVLEILNKK